MTWTRRGFLGATVATLAATMSATALSAGSGDIVQIEGPAFGAAWRVRVAAGADIGAIGEAVARVVAQIDAAMSPFRPDSEISRFNRLETLDWVPLAAGTIATIREAKRIATLSRGAFDPTLGGVVGRYGFGPMRGQPAGTFEGLALADAAARKAHPLQTLDLCGIAKGHALDLIVAGLTALGHENLFVELGGEVRAQGRHPLGRAWRAGIERPVPGAATVQRIVVVGNEALATSGDRVNGYDLGGRRYSHIIDPRHLQPADTPLASVSVFAPRAITADALATALFVMGPEQGRMFAEQNGIPALFVLRNGSCLTETMTAGFSGRITEQVLI